MAVGKDDGAGGKLGRNEYELAEEALDGEEAEPAEPQGWPGKRTRAQEAVPAQTLSQRMGPKLARSALGAAAPGKWSRATLARATAPAPAARPLPDDVRKQLEAALRAELAPKVLAHQAMHAAAANDQAQAAAPAGPKVEALDPGTRDRIERTTGESLGPVEVHRDDPDLAARGVLGEASGNVIRLSPELPGPDHPLGQRVRLHEAAHILQFRRPVEADGAARDAVQPGHEVEAELVAEAALAGERLPVESGADRAQSHGYPGEGLVNRVTGAVTGAIDILRDPVGFLRARFPAIAQLVTNPGGLEGLLGQVGNTLGAALNGMLKGLGLDGIFSGFNALLGQLSGDSSAFGILTGCCECLDKFLKGLMSSFQKLLASPTAKKLQSLIAGAGEANSEGFILMLTDFFGLLKKIGGPVMKLIEAAGAAIDSAKAFVGPLADRLWKWIAGALGLDVNLSPLEAIKKKLNELWQRAAAVLGPLKGALQGLWKILSVATPLGPLFTLFSELPKLVAAIRALANAKAKDAKAWLATARKLLQGTIFEPLLAVLQKGHTTLDAAGAAIMKWLESIFSSLGLLEAWQSSVSFLQAIGRAIKTIVGKVRQVLVGLGAKLKKVFVALAKAAKDLYDDIKPLLDFVVGLGMALGLAASGQIWAIPMFLLGNLWQHVLSDCYKEHLINFILDAFIALIEWIPVKGDANIVAGIMKAGALGFLKRMRAMDVKKKIEATNMVASLFAGNLEFAAGLFVGVLKGVYESTIGTVVFVFEAAAWVGRIGTMIAGGGKGEDKPGEKDAPPPEAEEKKKEEAPTEEKQAEAPKEEKDEDEGKDEEGLSESGRDEMDGDTPLNDEEPDHEGDDVEEEEQGEEGEDHAAKEAKDDEAKDDAKDDEAKDDGPESESDGEDSGSDAIDPPPAAPPDLFNGKALFEAVFKTGVTRAEIEQILKGIGTSAQAAAAKQGAQAADQIIAYLTKKGTAYEIGEAVGTVVGMVVVEVLIIFFTAGVGAGKTALTAAKLLTKLGKNLPKLAKIIRQIAHAVRPILKFFQSLKKGIGAWAGKFAKYIDDLIRWAEKSVKKLLGRVKRVKKKRPRIKRPRATRPRKPGARRPKRKPKRKKPRGKKDRLKIYAMQAARQAWMRLEASLGNRIHSLGVVKGRLVGMKVMKPAGARVQLSLKKRRSAWKVKARISKRGKFATAAFGRGWITKNETGQKFYAVKSNAALHQKIVTDHIRDLRREDDKQQSLRGEYETKRALGERLQREGQAEIEKHLHGIRYTITMEEFRGVEKDEEITTTLLITPNRTKRKPRVKLTSKSVYRGTYGSSNSFRGSFNQWKEEAWDRFGGYPSDAATRHPANDKYNGANGFVRRATGSFRKPGGSTPGNMHTDRWQAPLTSQREALKIQLYNEPRDKQGRLLPGKKAVSWLDADRRAMAQIAEEKTKGTEYAGMSYDEYFLVGWHEHHIKPCEWGGPGEPRKGGMIYVKKEEHKTIHQWWDKTEAAVKEELNEKGGVK